MSRRDCLLAALVATIWGFNFVVIDWGMGDVPPLVFVAVRFTLVLLPAIFVIPKPDLPWRTILGVGAFMSLGQFAFLYVSMDRGMPPGLAGLVLQAQVVLTILIAAVVLRERPTLAQGAGVLLGVVGLVTVALGRGGHVPLPALGLCLMGALMWAIGNVISRASGAKGGLALTVWSALVVPVPVLILALVVNGPRVLATAADAFGWKAALSTLFTSVLASLVGYAIFNGLLARNPSSAVVPWVLLVPPVSIGSAWLFLGEQPSLAEVLGGLLLIAGVLVTLRPSRGPVPTRSSAARPLPAQPAPSGSAGR